MRPPVEGIGHEYRVPTTLGPDEHQDQTRHQLSPNQSHEDLALEVDQGAALAKEILREHCCFEDVRFERHNRRFRRSPPSRYEAPKRACRSRSATVRIVWSGSGNGASRPRASLKRLRE